MSEPRTNGDNRRKYILTRIGRASGPVSATLLGQETGVSRQVIVQDIALLRSEGYDITATARGYTLPSSNIPRRLIKVCHSEAATEAELNAIVDLGGCVEDVVVNHHIYGRMSAPLHIKSRRDVRRFMDDIHSGKSTPLMNITSGYHFHHISADSEEILDEIEATLSSQGFIVEIFPYENSI